MIIKKDKKNYLIPNPKTAQGYNCYICGRRAENLHHCIFGNGKRKISDREGLVVALCSACHHNIHHYHTHDKELKAMAQEVWLEHHDQDRKKWYSMFYKFFDL